MPEINDPRLKVGKLLNIDEVCVGAIVKENAEEVMIDSDEFRGWARKDEILEAMSDCNEVDRL